MIKAEPNGSDQSVEKAHLKVILQVGLLLSDLDQIDEMGRFSLFTFIDDFRENRR